MARVINSVVVCGVGGVGRARTIYLALLGGRIEEQRGDAGTVVEVDLAAGVKDVGAVYHTTE